MLAETDIGDGEKLTSAAAVEEEIDAPLFSGALAAGGAANGLGVDLTTGLTTGLATGFLRATGTPFLMGVSSETTFTGVGLAVGFAAGALATGAFATGAFAAGVLAGVAFAGVATVRLVDTDFAQTVTDVGPVFDEYAKPPDDGALQAHTGMGESW